MEQNQKDSNIFLSGSIIVAALLIAGALVYSSGDGPSAVQDQKANQGASLGIYGIGGELADDDVVLGDPNAPVTIVEFGDYQCPFCGRYFTEVEPQLRLDYIKTGKTKMVFRDFAFLGPESQAAALASECAAEQGKFWAYHDKLYEVEIVDGKENNGNLSEGLLKSIASELGLNSESFDSCFASQKYREEVESDYNDGVAAGVNGTPATFVNGKMISGAQPYAVFKAEIEAALRAAR